MNEGVGARREGGKDAMAARLDRRQPADYGQSERGREGERGGDRDRQGRKLTSKRHLPPHLSHTHTHTWTRQTQNGLVATHALPLCQSFSPPTPHKHTHIIQSRQAGQLLYMQPASFFIEREIHTTGRMIWMVCLYNTHFCHPSIHPSTRAPTHPLPTQQTGQRTGQRKAELSTCLYACVPVCLPGQPVCYAMCVDLICLSVCWV